MAISLADLVDGKQIALYLHSGSQSGAMREVIKLLVANGKIDKPEKLLEQLHARELVNSTYAGDGIAFPHARTDLVNNIVLGIGRSEAGIAWTGRGEVARLIFLICVPEKLMTEYLVVIGAIARITKDRSLRTLLLHAETAHEFMETLLSVPSL
jgi:mannitol/fructose-specific phosphotransferase system IIA component (Ntr-type)